MTRLFAYTRVSTDDQAQEIVGAGFVIDPRRFVVEVVSGSVAAMERPGFARLVDRLDLGDTLVVTKLDRLGRNAIDVQQTVESVAGLGVKVKCLALGDTDLTSAAGKMIMQIISAMAEFERDLLIERTRAGQARARSEGKRFGRPSVLDERQRQVVLGFRAQGEPVASIARKLAISRRTVDRVAPPVSRRLKTGTNARGQS